MINSYNLSRPSGDEWLGTIPDHWKVSRLKYVADASPSNVDKKSMDGEESIELCNYVDVYKNDYIKRGMSFMRATASADQIEKFTLAAGDVLLTKDSEDPADIAVPALVIEDLPGVICGYHLTRVRPNQKELRGDYLFRLFQSYRFNQQFTVKANGVTRFGLPSAAFSDAVICIPPVSEQRTIAAYLNSKTSLIDNAIQKKQRLIELLEEERSGIINDAVTKGINPDVPMQPSGLEWLGEVPAHWQVKKLKYVVNKVGSGVTPKGGAQVYQESGIPLLRSQNVYFDGLRLDDVAYINQDIHDSMSGTTVLPGDVLLNITGASIGRCYFVEDWLGEANVNQHVCILRPSRHINTKFLYYLLRSSLGQTQIDRLQNGANREGLNFEQLKSFNLPLPSIHEQNLIVEYLSNLENRVIKTVNRILAEIDLLAEYRTALINEVVTGKRCVLDEVQNEHDEYIDALTETTLTA